MKNTLVFFILMIAAGCVQDALEPTNPNKTQGDLPETCFPEGLPGPEKGESIFLERYKELASKYNNSFNCTIDTYRPYFDALEALSNSQDSVFLHCSDSSMDGYTDELSQRFMRKEYVTSEFSHGPILILTQLVTEDGELIKDLEGLREHILPFDSPEEVFVYAHYATKGTLSGEVKEIEDTPLDEPFTPCVRRKHGGWEVTMRSDIHSGGCQPMTLDKLTFLITDEGEVTLITTENLYTSEYLLCVD